MILGIDSYLWLKWLHVLSSTVLFGTGIGTAFQMWFAHRRGDARSIAVVARNVVLADWLFTLPAGVLQPLTGLALAARVGIDLATPWLVVTYLLYLLAFVCWVPVAVLQMRARDLAERAVRENKPLPPEYREAMRLWFMLGWPAFIGLVVIYLLMVAKPDFW